MQRFGIDISEYQKGMDYDRAIREGVEFVILRGADSYYQDSQFETYYTQWQKRNIPIGVYHYTRCTTVEEAKQEAAFLLKTVLKDKQLSYPVYMDVETQKQRQAGKKQMTDAVIAYCEEIKKAGYTPGIYASLSFIEDHLDDSRLGDYEKWIAQWYTQCNYTGNLGMWQFGGETNLLRSNQVAGMVCDQNYCYTDYQGTETTDDFCLPLRILREGSVGADVRALQHLLMTNGWDGGTWGADGNYGKQTTQAVTEYQRKKGISADGIAGPETMTSLLK